jgi:hypothetical protein
MLETVRQISGDETPLWVLGWVAIGVLLLLLVIVLVNRWIELTAPEGEPEASALDRRDWRTSDERWDEFDRSQGRESDRG